MDNKKFKDFCHRGEGADALYTQGKYPQACQAYLELLTQIDQHGEVDSFLLAKITLGLMRSQLKMAQIQQAFSIWNSDMEDSLFGIGIYALENAQTDVHDLVSYDLICAYLHSVSAANPESTGRAVNQYMSRVCEHAWEAGDLPLMKGAISNWKQHLKDVFPTHTPPSLIHALIEFERKLPEPVRLQALEFGPISSWERPVGFQEMSRVVDIKPKQSGPPEVAYHKASGDDSGSPSKKPRHKK